MRRWACGQDNPLLKLHLNKTANRRISNNPPPADRISKGGFAPLSLFYKKIKYLPSTFDIRYSIFAFNKFPLSIKLAALQASGPPSAETLNAEP